MRISSIIDGLVSFMQSVTTVNENLNQLDDVLKLMMNTHQQKMTFFKIFFFYQCFLSRSLTGQSLDDIDEKMLLFKHQTNHWIRESKDDQNSNSASKPRTSRSSKHWGKFGKSRAKSPSMGRSIKKK